MGHCYHALAFSQAQFTRLCIPQPRVEHLLQGHCHLVCQATLAAEDGHEGCWVHKTDVCAQIAGSALLWGREIGFDRLAAVVVLVADSWIHVTGLRMQSVRQAARGAFIGLRFTLHVDDLTIGDPVYWLCGMYTSV